MQPYQAPVLLFSGGTAVLFLLSSGTGSQILNAVKGTENATTPITLKGGPAMGGGAVGSLTGFWTTTGGMLVLALLYVAGLTWIAGFSPDAGKLMLAVAVGVLLLYLVNNGSKLKSLTGGLL